MKIRAGVNPFLLLIAPATLIPIFFDTDLSSRTDIVGMAITIAVLLLIEIPICICALKSYYIFESDHLLYVMWFWKKRIPYHEISKVMISRNPSSSPALTFRRVAIYTQSIWLQDLFSIPIKKDRQRFKEEIAQRCPHANIDLSKLGL